jgi:hypothetical protein
MYQKRILPYYNSLLSHPKLLPLWSVTDGRTNFNTPCYLSSFFFPLSAQGPTRKRNSTGLAELWGGWPIEQVDDFAIAAPDQHTADILMDLLDDQLTMPIKRQGLLDMFNGVDVVQTLRKIGIPLPSAATWRMHLKL